jgi:hypothetical protein
LRSTLRFILSQSHQYKTKAKHPEHFFDLR